MEIVNYGVFNIACSNIISSKRFIQKALKRKHRINIETVFSNPLIKLLD